MCFGEKTGRSAFIAVRGTEVVRLNETPSIYESPICIGESVPISVDGRHICDVGLYVSPAGAITVCIPLALYDGDVPSDGLLTIRRVADVMRRWTHQQLDEIAADHFYQRDGQAALVIDAMARRGLLGYSCKQTFYDSIDEALSGSNLLFVPTEPSNAPMSRREFIKAFSANRGIDPDDLTGFICELETIGGVVAVVRGSQLIVSYYGPDGVSLIPLFYFKILPNRSDVFVLPLTVRHCLEKNGFPVSAATGLLEFFIRFADKDLLNPSPVDGRVAMLYLKPDALFSGVGDLVSQIKSFACALSS